MIWLFTLILLGVWPASGHACQLYRNAVQDTSGNAIAGTSIAVTAHGTSTSAALYTDYQCTLVESNPLTSDADGTFQFFVEDGIYDIAFTKTGYTFTPVEAVSLFDPLGQHVKTVGMFASTDLCASTSGAIDQIGGTVTTLIINKAMTCSVDKTVPSTLDLIFTGQGGITIASGKTLTINSSVLAPPRNIFSGAGSYTLSSTRNPIQYDQWNGSLGTAMTRLSSIAFASLGTPSNGSFTYCADCTIANPCAGGGSGAFAKRLNGVWVCN